MRVLIIIPAYNEEKNILKTVRVVTSYTGMKLDYIVINDGSTDGTKKVLQENHLNYINLSTNLGIGPAVQTGYKYAYDNNYDIAIQFDGDGQHDISFIPDLVNEIVENHYDMVIGSRFNGSKSSFKSTWPRRIGIRLLSRIIKYYTGVKIYDTTSGFRAINRKVIKLFRDEYSFDYPEPISTMMVILNGFRVKEIAVNMKEREFGKSSITFNKSIYYMLNVCLTMAILGRSKKHVDKT